CVVAAIFTPTFYAGALGIGLHLTSALLAWYHFSASMKGQLASPEPAGIILFALAALVVLFFRFRHVIAHNSMSKAIGELLTLRKLASASLKLRDELNTPIQNM